MINKKITIVGGSGFLGSHLADLLSSKKYLVTIFDKKKSIYLKNNQKIIIGDITKKKDVEKAIKNSDIVFHFAGISDIEESNLNPTLAVYQNIYGTSLILDTCKKYKVKKFFFASSIYVFSKLGGIYKTTKESGELLIENYGRIFNLDFVILRFGSLYGERSNKNNSIYNFIYQALTTGKIIRKGSGNEIREYIHVKDACDSCLKLLEQKKTYKYITLTGINTIKISDLLSMINEILGSKIKIIYSKKRIKEHYEITPYSFIPKTSKKFFNKSQFDLGQGIFEIINLIHKDLNK